MALSLLLLLSTLAAPVAAAATATAVLLFFDSMWHAANWAVVHQQRASPAGGIRMHPRLRCSLLLALRGAESCLVAGLTPDCTCRRNASAG